MRKRKNKDDYRNDNKRRKHDCMYSTFEQLITLAHYDRRDMEPKRREHSLEQHKSKVESPSKNAPSKSDDWQV
jgi:hypothetical protein